MITSAMMELIETVLEWVTQDCRHEYDHLNIWLRTNDTMPNINAIPHYRRSILNYLRNCCRSINFDPTQMMHRCVKAMHFEPLTVTNWTKVHDWQLITNLCNLGALALASIDGECALGIALSKNRSDLASRMMRYSPNFVRNRINGELVSIDYVNPVNSNGQTLLHVIIENFKAQPESGQYIKRLIDLGVHINRADFNGITCVHLLAYHGHYDLLKSLGVAANLSAVTNDGDDIMLMTCRGIHRTTREWDIMEFIDDLLIKGFNANVKNNYGFTPLHYAARGPSVAIVSSLVCAGADVRALASDNTTPLHAAATSSDFEVFDYLRNVIHGEMDYATRDMYYGLSIVGMAAVSDDVRIGDWIIEHARGSTGVTPLHMAAFVGNLSVVQKLIDHNTIDVNCKESKFGFSPLHVAAMYGQSALHKALGLDSNSHLSLVDHCLSGMGHRDTKFADAIIRALVRAGADVNARDAHGRTPLHYSMAHVGRTPLRDSVPIIGSLLELGADVDVQDFVNCRTPLQECMLRNNQAGFELLLRHGANVNDVDMISAILPRNLRYYGNSYVTILMRHIIKMETVGIPVNKVYRCIRRDNWKPFYDKCHAEMRRLKNERIDYKSTITLFDVLRMNFRHRAKVIDAALAQSVTFPLYAPLIRNTCCESVNRARLIESAKMSLFELSAPYCLPDICLEHIMAYLQNSTLRALSDAGMKV